MRALTLTPIAALAMALAANAQAQAQDPATDTIPLTITFNGSLYNDPSGGILIESYDSSGNYSSENYDGDAPDHPYQQGDNVTFTVETLMPSQAELQSGAFDHALQPDGTFAFELTGPNNAGTSAIGVISDFDVTGPIHQTNSAGQLPTGNGLTVHIDPVDNSYSLSTPASGWIYGSFDGPGYVYNPASGTLSPSDSTCAGGVGGCAATGEGGFSFRSDNLKRIYSQSTPIYSTDDEPRGLFSLFFNGSWNLPTYRSSDPTPVPEPGVLLLFGAGAAAVFRRRRKKSRKQAA